MKYKITPTDRAQEMRSGDFIVSKTDLKGIITYANRIFLEFAQYSEEEMLGKPHNIIRHPDMPRAVFKLLWETVEKGNEIFAYVKNMAKDGSYYWVFANITPVRDESGKIVGYYFVRRKPEKKALDAIIPLYRQLLAEEKRHEGQKQIEASMKMLNAILAEKGVSYEKFILSL